MGKGMLYLNNTHGDILLEYSRWLMDANYMDTDWMYEAEGENTVEEFLMELKDREMADKNRFLVHLLDPDAEPVGIIEYYTEEDSSTLITKHWEVFWAMEPEETNTEAFIEYLKGEGVTAERVHLEEVNI